MRRIRGEGFIAAKPRADGRIEGRYWTVDGNGRPVRRSVYGKTKSDVAQKLRAALMRHETGVASLSDRETVGVHLDAWLEASRPTVRARTWDRNAEHVRLHLDPLLGRRPLAKLSPDDVQRAYAALLNRGLSPATVRRAHAVLRSSLEQAVRWRRLPVNVATLVDLPRVQRREMHVLSTEEARRLVEGVADDRLGALYVVAVTAGLRQGELLALRWHDVDLDHGAIAVTASLARAHNDETSWLEISEVKSARSRRRVDLTSVAIDALRRRRQLYVAERLHAGSEYVDRQLVFASLVGGFIHVSWLTKEFHALLERLELPRIRFHDLRHTAATLMLAQGVHPKVASEMLGHSTVSITLDLYSHVTPTMQQHAAAAVDSLFH